MRPLRWSISNAAASVLPSADEAMACQPPFGAAVCIQFVSRRLESSNNPLFTLAWLLTDIQPDIKMFPDSQSIAPPNARSGAIAVLFENTQDRRVSGPLVT